MPPEHSPTALAALAQAHMSLAAAATSAIAAAIMMHGVLANDLTALLPSFGGEGVDGSVDRDGGVGAELGSDGAVVGAGPGADVIAMPPAAADVV